MDAIKVLLPIFTFFLGAIFTLYLRRIDTRKRQIEQAITEIADLSNQWYEQLNDIRVIKDFEGKSHEVEKKMYLYINNRLILPKYLKNLELLKKHKRCTVIYKQAQLFLFLVTKPVKGVYSADSPLYVPPRKYDNFLVRRGAMPFSCIAVWEPDTALEKSLTFLDLIREEFIKDSKLNLLGLLRAHDKDFKRHNKGPIVKSERGEIVKYDDTRAFDLIMNALDSVVQAINQEAGKVL